MSPRSAIPAAATSLSKYGVVVALFVLAMLTYVDRTSISTAKDPIAAELQLSDSEMGMAFSAFALGYALTQIPAGWLADKIGPRAVLAGTVASWSILTSLTGAAWSFASLLTIRFLFGAGEAAVFPASARAVRNWLKPGERGRANGAIFAGSRIGAALSYPLLVYMLTLWKWRNVFLILGIAGLAWVAVWLMRFKNYPQGERLEHGEAALGAHAAGETEVSVATPLTLAMLQYFASNFTNFIGLSWMLPYLKAEYHLTSSEAAVYSMAPLLLGATSQVVSGSAIDRMYASSLRRWSRRLPAIIGFSLAAVGLLGVTRANSVGVAVFALTIAIFGADMTLSPSWVFCADVAGKRIGRLSGAMNMSGSIGAFASANAFPFLIGRTGSASVYFILAALLDAASILCWLRMRSPGFHNTRLGPDSEMHNIGIHARNPGR